MKKSNGYLRQDRSRNSRTKRKGRQRNQEHSKQDDAKTHAGRRTNGRYKSVQPVQPQDLYDEDGETDAYAMMMGPDAY